MRILLVKPPSSPSLTGVKTLVRDEIVFGMHEPYELELLAAAVSDADIKILDMRIEPNLERTLEEFEPDLVGVTCYTMGVYWAKQILATAKSFNHFITTAVGGHHATFCPGDFHEPYVDVIVIGPGEETFNNIVCAMRKTKDFSGIKGIHFRNKGKFIDTGAREISSDFSTVPLARRDLTANYKGHYHVLGEGPFALIEVSRGCAFKCKFCSIWKSLNNKYFIKPPEAIVDELENMEEEHIICCDPNTTHDVKQITKMLDLLEKRGVRKQFHINGRVNTIAKHPGMIGRWAELGLKHILIGFESIKGSDIKDYKKQTSLEMQLRALDVLKKHNIISLAMFIVRQDFDEDDFEALADFVLKNDILAPAFTVLTPLPGSDLFGEASHSLTSKNYEMFDFGHTLLPTKLPLDEFYKQVVNLYDQAYSPSRLLKRLPLYFADLMVNHWKWRQREITGVKEPWRSNIRSVSISQALGAFAADLRITADMKNAAGDELLPYPPPIDFH